jgi:hypothetical protein
VLWWVGGVEAAGLRIRNGFCISQWVLQWLMHSQMMDAPAGIRFIRESIRMREMSLALAKPIRIMQQALLGLIFLYLPMGFSLANGVPLGVGFGCESGVRLCRTAHPDRTSNFARKAFVAHHLSGYHKHRIPRGNPSRKKEGTCIPSGFDPPLRRPCENPPPSPPPPVGTLISGGCV